MSWKKLVAESRVEAHATSQQELDDLRGIVERNLKDARLQGLSPDNKFGLAYEAALLLGKMVLSCAGYRAKGQGIHRTTFEALVLALGKTASNEADYFDRCRRKRNDLSYDAAGLVTSTEADGLLGEVLRFQKTVEAWIASSFPSFGL